MAQSGTIWRWSKGLHSRKVNLDKGLRPASSGTCAKCAMALRVRVSRSAGNAASQVHLAFSRRYTWHFPDYPYHVYASKGRNYSKGRLKTGVIPSCLKPSLRSMGLNDRDFPRDRHRPEDRYQTFERHSSVVSWDRGLVAVVPILRRTHVLQNEPVLRSRRVASISSRSAARSTRNCCKASRAISMTRLRKTACSMTSSISGSSFAHRGRLVRNPFFQGHELAGYLSHRLRRQCCAASVS